MYGRRIFFALSVLSAIHSQPASSKQTQELKSTPIWMQIRASTVEERDIVANTGASIESIDPEFVMAIGTAKERDQLKALGILQSEMPLDLTAGIGPRDFPGGDAQFHNYAELGAELKVLAAENPDLVALSTLGKSVEGREIYHLTLSTDLTSSGQKPGVVFLGGHHAREHISIETPLLLAKYLVKNFRSNDPAVRRALTEREIHIVPLVNPDGAEYDIASGQYQYWRKNRGATSNRNEVGVDLNRNYDWKWGTVGASPDPSSETYRGTSAFSEPESRAIKQFIETQKNISILLSFHTFSELILYPWGHTHSPLSDSRDLQVHKTMAEKMATWNGYRPMQSSQLYAASGDTTDWSYGAHHIFSFTFELDPKDMWSGGFYPGQDQIEVVFNKNISSCLYLIDLADNPYRVLTP